MRAPGPADDQSRRICKFVAVECGTLIKTNRGEVKCQTLCVAVLYRTHAICAGITSQAAGEDFLPHTDGV
jgi:hypothetical protein